MEEQVIRECKTLINRAASLETLQNYYQDFLDTDFGETPLDAPYILQKVYIHACLRKRTDIANWLTPMFASLDPISHIAYRQTIRYGQFLLRK
jgi:hypothetical protein